MVARDEESQAVMGAAMRYLKNGDRSELESFPLSVLKKADYQLSNRDEGSGYRRAIKDLIDELLSANGPDDKSADSERIPISNEVQRIVKKSWHEGFVGNLMVSVIAGVLLIFIGNFINTINLESSSKKGNEEQQVALQEIKIPVTIESTWNENSDLDRKAEFYIVRSVSPGTQSVIYSGSAKVQIPENGMTVNGMISIAPHKTTKTTVILPKEKELNKYLEAGGYEIQLVLLNQYGYVFMNMEQKLFDKEILERGFKYWFRSIPEQIPNKSLNQIDAESTRPG